MIILSALKRIKPDWFWYIIPARVNQGVRFFSTVGDVHSSETIFCALVDGVQGTSNAPETCTSGEIRVAAEVRRFGRVTTASLLAQSSAKSGLVGGMYPGLETCPGRGPGAYEVRNDGKNEIYMLVSRENVASL